MCKDSTNWWRRPEHEVYANVDRKEFSCNCKMFEQKGILCCHVLRVMFQYGISEIPDRYILKRWTKNARDYIPSHLQGYKDDEDAAASRTYRHSMLSRLSMELARRGNKDVETYRKTIDAMSQLLDDLKIGESSQDDASVCEAQIDQDGNSKEVNILRIIRTMSMST
ncbi:protein FAR-RED IMPAIRED RESPONSE 1-like [Phragmites australis]|uniref:protein FAR-RED IMPAIRED RESPONSE 1-like n=1 Tax=Phragmites australis TaxID=29695 RepID=UPI002D7951E3|nr:protein FAR-RED IMPAIRED RESPONSE 1-like [Phragmites australis]